MMGKLFIVIVVVVTLVFGVSSVSAQGVKARVSTNSASPSAGVGFSDAKLDRYRSKILAEVDRRIGILNELLSKTSNSDKMNSQAKNIVVANLTSVLNRLTNTRAVVLSGNDIATLRAQAKVAVDEYKTFTLVFPQSEILRVAESQLKLSTQLASLSARLSSNASATSSANLANLAAVNNFLSQINARANAVVSEMSALQVGGATANRSVLVEARSSLQKNVADFKQIMTELRKMFKEARKL